MYPRPGARRAWAVPLACPPAGRVQARMGRAAAASRQHRYVDDADHLNRARRPPTRGDETFIAGATARSSRLAMRTFTSHHSSTSKAPTFSSAVARAFPPPRRGLLVTCCALFCLLAAAQGAGSPHPGGTLPPPEGADPTLVAGSHARGLADAAGGSGVKLHWFARMMGGRRLKGERVLSALLQHSVKGC
jgi:hypothetical protein